MLEPSPHPTIQATNPREFMTDYVEPAIAASNADQTSKHLAIHALTQLDVLAEVTVNWQAVSNGRAVAKFEVSNYRDKLGQREHSLAIVRDAHDSHKHGQLNRQNATNVSRGQRPQMVRKYAYFCNVSYIGGPPTAYNQLAIKLNDGVEYSTFKLIFDAHAAWLREFEALGL